MELLGTQFLNTDQRHPIQGSRDWNQSGRERLIVLTWYGPMTVEDQDHARTGPTKTSFRGKLFFVGVEAPMADGS